MQQHQAPLGQQLGLLARERARHERRDRNHDRQREQQLGTRPRHGPGSAAGGVGVLVSAGVGSDQLPVTSPNRIATKPCPDAGGVNASPYTIAPGMHISLAISGGTTVWFGINTGAGRNTQSELQR